MVKKVIVEGDKLKTPKVKPVENRSKNQQSFLELIPVQQKEVLLLHKLQDHVYE